MDFLYNYLLLMGSNDRLNQVMLQKVVSTRKMELMEDLESMDEKDVRIYNNLASQINVFLDTKEAIRKAVIEESLVRNDLMRCIQDNIVKFKKNLEECEIGLLTSSLSSAILYRNLIIR